MLIDVDFVLDELVLHQLLQVGPFGSQIRHPIHHVLHQMKPVQFVLHPYVERRRDRAFFLVASDMQVPIGPTIGQPVDQPRIAVKAEDDVLIFGEEGIVVGLAQSMRVLACRLELHQIDDIDHPDF